MKEEKDKKITEEEKEKAILELKRIAYYHLQRKIMQSSTRYGNKLTKEQKIEAELKYIELCKKIDNE